MDADEREDETPFIYTVGPKQSRLSKMISLRRKSFGLAEERLYTFGPS